MKGLLFCIVLGLTLSTCSYSQERRANPFQTVRVPDSVNLQLAKITYNGSPEINAQTGLYVWNLQSKKDLVFKEGIYSFKGIGPHFPRRIFIFNKGFFFIFENEGAFNPKGVLQEFVESINKLNLTDSQTVKYSKVVSEYLEQESGNTYGKEIK